MTDDGVMDYRTLRADAREQLREGAVEAAERLLSTEGVEAVSVRRVAELLGASRQVVYTHFGGKRGLADALYRRGFRRLREDLEAVPRTDRPVADLRAVVEAYRRAALERPVLYAVMFGSALAEFAPLPASVDEAGASFGVLVAAVRRCPGAPADPEVAAEVLWGVAHGLVGLRLAGFLIRPPRDEERFADAVDAALRGLGLDGPTAPD